MAIYRGAVARYTDGPRSLVQFSRVQPAHHTIASGANNYRLTTPCRAHSSECFKEQMSSQSVSSTDGGGICLWLTGLSGSGKSTTATVLATLLESRRRRVSVLDGDEVRKILSTELGYSKSDRDTNVRRIAFVAREIVRHGGIAICATISPYRHARSEARALIGERFVEIYVDCPLEVCEARDPKGMYKFARLGKIPDFTGISAPYEVPACPEVTISTLSRSVHENAHYIVDYLIASGMLESA